MTRFDARSADSNAASASAFASTLNLRRWVRRDTPLPFLWSGLWPLLGLVLVTAFALGPLAKGRIEKSVRNEVRDTLDEENHRWAQLAVSGQNVRLSGVPPSISAGDEAMSVARAAACPSWAGPLTCAVQVTGQFDAPVPPPPTPSQPLTQAGESLLPAVAAVVAVTAAAVAAPAEGVEKTASQACERSMADVVAKSRIEFATASSEIAERSAPTLNALAAAAKTCVGQIEVQGHTDSVGQPERNLKLSDARAESVRQALVARGLAADRLTSTGFGVTRPIAENDTPEGRAQNRRIEFRVKALP